MATQDTDSIVEYELTWGDEVPVPGQMHFLKIRLDRSVDDYPERVVRAFADGLRSAGFTDVTLVQTKAEVRDTARVTIE